MRRRLAGLGRRAEADGGLAGDERGLVGGLRLGQRRGDRLYVVTIDAHRVPAGRLETLHLVGRIRQRQSAVDGNAVVIEQHDQLRQFEMAGERNGFLRNAFHQVAVGGEHIRLVIDDGVAEHGCHVAFRHRHADGIGEALAERAGGGLDAGGVAIFRMTGRDRAGLTEALDLIDRHGRVAGEIEQGIHQHRAVAGRQHEAVAIGPFRVGGIELQELGKQHGRHVGGAHRQAGMAGIGLLHGVHGQRADGIGHIRSSGNGWRRGVCCHGKWACLKGFA